MNKLIIRKIIEIHLQSISTFSDKKNLYRCHCRPHPNSETIVYTQRAVRVYASIIDAAHKKKSPHKCGDFVHNRRGGNRLPPPVYIFFQPGSYTILRAAHRRSTPVTSSGRSPSTGRGWDWRWHGSSARGAAAAWSSSPGAACLRWWGPGRPPWGRCRSPSGSRCATPWWRSPTWPRGWWRPGRRSSSRGGWWRLDRGSRRDPHPPGRGARGPSPPPGPPGALKEMADVAAWEQRGGGHPRRSKGGVAAPHKPLLLLNRRPWPTPDLG